MKKTKGVSPRAVASRTFLLIYRECIDLRIGVARGSSELKGSSFLCAIGPKGTSASIGPRGEKN